MTSIVCVGLAAYVGRQRYLEHSVNSFNALMDEQRYSEAEALAKHVHRWYGTVLTECMLEKATFARQWSAVDGGGCFCGAPGSADPDWQFSHLKEWEELTSAKKSR
ncbi:MAG: hypothetical protein WEH44_06555 [Pirellulaceae bacterium]